ncbi:hypothetical protein BC827DRAFT_905013 [Russula dissimulans]|nr:hypothetical protein BC827DRAFT_905013 [Russula dissimulans]
MKNGTISHVIVGAPDALATTHQSRAHWATSGPTLADIATIGTVTFPSTPSTLYLFPSRTRLASPFLHIYGPSLDLHFHPLSPRGHYFNLSVLVTDLDYHLDTFCDNNQVQLPSKPLRVFKSLLSHFNFLFADIRPRLTTSLLCPVSRSHYLLPPRLLPRPFRISLTSLVSIASVSSEKRTPGETSATELSNLPVDPCVVLLIKIVLEKTGIKKETP